MAGVTALWYTTRASGTVALVLLTLSIVLGVAQVGRLRSGRWPRFVIDGLHRHTALLAAVFLTLHIATAVLDTYAPITLTDVFIPFTSAYRPLWLGLGATALDLLLAVAITSLVRVRLGHRLWRAVHWLAYVVWPVAFAHGLGTGSDVRQSWMGIIAVICGAAVLVAVAIRIGLGWPAQRGLRITAAGLALAYVAAMVIWLPSGPLGANWAQRAGTPVQLLSPARAGSTS
jgi:methionine sulfoxide reductase heme-binding subunit